MTVVHAGEKKTIVTGAGQSILASLRDHGFYVDAPCGGGGRCGKCRVQMTAGAPHPLPEEARLFTPAQLAAGWRLSCLHTATEDMEIVLGGGADSMAALSQFWPAEEMSALVRVEMAGQYGVGVDIGTTTVALALVALDTGEVKAVHTFLNPQSPYGADVISRIQYTSDHPGVLAAVIRQGLAAGIVQLLADNGISHKAIARCAIAGNTTMLYLLAGRDAGPLAVAPFTAAFISLEETTLGALLAGALDDALGDVAATLLPSLSAYVGADITAGMLFAGFDSWRTRPSELAPAAAVGAGKAALFIDIGTNGEVAAIRAGRVVCASTAAGPAFEGASIHHGIGSVAGAISQVRLDDGRAAIHTIGDKLPPVGICGSAVLDTVAEGLRTGLVDDSGFLEAPITLWEGVEREPIVFLPRDVREVQLAKAAIRAGIEVLMETLGCTDADVETLYIAGGFGSHMNPHHAAAIGMIPPGLRDKIVLLGNSALGGCVQYLVDPAARRALDDIVAAAVYLELSSHPRFNALYVEHMVFEEAEG